MLRILSPDLDQDSQLKEWDLEAAKEASFACQCHERTNSQTAHYSIENEWIKDLYFQSEPNDETSCASESDIDEELMSKDNILLELEEQIFLKSPLEMRELPDLTHGFATWNVCNGFEPSQIATIMLRCNLSILIIQEPRATFNEIEVGFSKKILLQHGIKGTFMKYQYLLFNERALGARISNITTQMEGRLISCDLQIGPLSENTFIKLHGCYAVTQGDKLYKDGFTRNQRRQQLHKTVIKALKPDKKYIGTMLAGDLQETITTTSRDNKGGKYYDRMKFGVLDAIEQSSRSMCSAVFEYESDEKTPYITRTERSNSNSGRGITHIMVTSKVEELYVGGCVDSIISSTSILSDHHLVAADLLIDVPPPPPHTSQPTRRTQWGKISNIKVEAIYEDDEDSIPTSIIPLRNTPHTDEWKEKVTIFQDIQQIAGEGSTLEQEVAEIFLKEMIDLQEELFRETKLMTKADQKNGQLIERCPSYQNRLEKAYILFKNGTLEIAKTLKFVSQEDPLDKMDKRIRDKKNLHDICGNTSASGTFTSILKHGKHLRATAKALQRTAGKTINTNVDEALYKNHMRMMQRFAQRLIMLGDQYRLGDRLVDAIEMAEYHQSEREKIQHVYKTHRTSLDKFQGQHRGNSKVEIDDNEVKELNVLLKEAGCNHLLNSETMKDCQIRTDETTREWNKVQQIYKNYDKSKRWIDLMSDKTFHDAINETVSALEAISRSANYQRRKFKLLHIRHAALTMSTKDLSRLLLPKAGDLPEPQMTIIDDKTGMPRPCESDEEVLKATNIKEQAYMTPPDVERQIHFGELTYDKVGVNGIKIAKGRLINDENMAKTMPNYDNLGEEVKHHIKEAHEYMKDLFEYPITEAKALNYPFFLDCETGQFSDELLTKNFYKAITSVPGSNRHEGYHMSVLGRFPGKWQKGMLLFLQNVLITRCPPPAIKEMSRILIPKGDKKPGQTRPISMADDTFSFLTNEISNRMATGIEETGRMGDEIKAYRKGKSTSDITVEERLIREEALEHTKLLGIVQEDEEKFFDRPSKELQLIVMKLFGFPPQGYTEWKSEDMLDRLVHVITRYGITITKFLTGVPQGSTLSVYIANLIIWVKHKVMRLDEVKGLIRRKNPFKFEVWDSTGLQGQEGDERPIRYSNSYCDDNNGFHGAKNLKMLKEELLKQVRMTGKFSIATRLGRAGSKCQIYVYNVDPNDAEEILAWKFEAYAWSFAAGTVVKEETPVVYHFVKTSERMEDISPANITAMKELEKRHGPTKHLGVTYRTDKPDYTQTGVLKCNQALARLSRMNFRSIDDKAIAIIINTFIISYAQFAALEADVQVSDLNRVDRAIINKVRKGYSLAKRDMKEVMLIPHQQLGMNIRSFLGTMLAAKPRELECRLNGKSDCSISMRARWQSWAKRNPETNEPTRMELAKRGLLERNVRFEALFGIYLRDKRYNLCNIMVDSILLDLMDGSLKKTKKKRVGAPIGHKDFRRTTTGILGEGDESLLAYATFSILFNAIRYQMEEIEGIETAPKWGDANSWHSKQIGCLKNHNIDASRLAAYARHAITQVKNDTQSTVMFAEWLGEMKFTTECPINALDWAKGTQAWMIPNKCEDHGVIKMDTTDMENKIKNHYGQNKRLGAEGNGSTTKTWIWDELNNEMDLERKTPGGIGEGNELFLDLIKRCHPDQNQLHGGRRHWFQMEDREELIRRYFEDKGCPYFLAEDGGNYTLKANGEDRGAKVAVLWAPKMSDNETFEDIIESWQNRPAIPIAARVYTLPKCIGIDKTHCGHSEIGALNMGIDWFDMHDPCMHILDSNATVYNARSMRDEATPSMRRRIRGTGVAAGKGECERLRASIKKWKDPGGEDLRAPWNHRQRMNLEKIVKAMQEWNQPKWPRMYRDKDTKHPIMLVDSHQLDDRGKLTGQRYKTMVPCKAMVMANELADKICMVTLGIKGTNHCLQTLPTPEDIRYPPNNLRFTFSNMGRTLNGDTPATIERLVRDTLWWAAASKIEQGRILRILDKSNLNAKIIGRKGALSNLLRHLAQSHSQNYYRCNEYKELHDKYGEVPKVKGKKHQKELNVLCPFCKHIPNQYQAKANTRHYHIYCPNIRISQVRHATSKCLEKIVLQFTNTAAELKQLASMETLLWELMNRNMNEIVTNDCGLRKGEGTEGEMGTPYTLNALQWQDIHNDPKHELHPQIISYPYSSAIGLITSRKECEWKDNHTNSSDLTFLGAIPLILEETVQEYCRNASKGVEKKYYKKCQEKCKELKAQWKKVETFVRAKPIIIQKAVSAQLQIYKKEMQKKDQEREDQVNDKEEHIEEEDIIEDDPKLVGEKVIVIRTCVGKKCHLNQTPKQFNSTGTRNRSGPKKCSVCRVFEPALKKCLAIEKYFITQLKEPDEDIDMFKMLQGLSGMMVDSKGRKVKNYSYFEELLKIPIVKKVLKDPKLNKNRVYAQNAIKPMEMLAATFGIVLVRGTGSPFPSLNLETARELWAKHNQNKKARDMWEQIQWNIHNHSIGSRLKEIEDGLKYIGADVKSILARAGRVNQVNDLPHSILTTLPRKMKGRWDKNIKKCKDKIDTATKALKLRENLSRKEKRKIQLANIRKHQREEDIFQGRTQTERTSSLPNNSNIGKDAGIQGNDHKDNAKKKTSGDIISGRIKINKRTYTEDEDKTTNIKNSPIKASRTARIRSINQLTSRQIDKIQQTNNMIEISSDNNGAINKIIELSSDEDDPVNPNAKTMPTLFSLHENIFTAIITTDALLPSAGIQAMIELIHRDTNRSEISCVNTDLYSYLLKRKDNEAMNLLHPDDRCKTQTETIWETPEKRQATANSKILLIPCHFEEKNKKTNEIILRHWVLAVRIRNEGGQYKLWVFDSCGVKWARKRMSQIRKQLMRIKIMEDKDAWEAPDLKIQTEQECGIRTMHYMWKFKQWAETEMQPAQITRQLKSLVGSEKATKKNLAREYRSQMYRVLKRGKNAIGG